MIKNKIKKNKYLYVSFIKTREILRIIFNTKTRSRFLWNLRKGDTKLALNYPLTSESVVVDVGSYKGEFIEKLNLIHNPIIHAVEPLEVFSKYLEEKFGNYPNLIIHNFGLLDVTKEVKISNLDAGSSIFNRKEGNTTEIIKVKSMIDFMEQENLQEIDLLNLNIEGSEYPLLNHIIDTGLIGNIKHIQIQFHNFVENAQSKRKELRKLLRKTHKCVYNFPFIWERWDKI